jgi:HEPN domain-containing protein
MSKTKIIKNWIDRARSNLEIANPEKISKVIFYEDLCYNAQQCVEKALKAYCIYYDIEFPKTHNIGKLFNILENAKIKIPEYIKKSSELSDYSVEKRYPGNYEEVDEKEYKRVVKIAEDVFNWVNKKIKLK